MTRAQSARLAIAAIGGVLALIWLARFGWSAGGIAGLVALFVATGIIAERAFARLASDEERRADLEERVRNPPS